MFEGSSDSFYLGHCIVLGTSHEWTRHDVGDLHQAQWSWIKFPIPCKLQLWHSQYFVHITSKVPLHRRGTFEGSVAHTFKEGDRHKDGAQELKTDAAPWYVAIAKALHSHVTPNTAMGL